MSLDPLLEEKEGKSYNWLDWLIFLLGETSLETRQLKTAVTGSLET